MTDDLFDVADGGCFLRLHVLPGAGRTAVVGRHGDALKVRVAAPPEKGRANDACRSLVSEITGVPETDVVLVGGERSRTKRLLLKSIEPEELRQRLDVALDDADVPPGGTRRDARSRRR